MTRRILIDCSSTRTCEFNSGIQRVVRGLCSQAKSSGVLSGVAGTAVYGREGRFVVARELYPTKNQMVVDQIVQSRISKGYRHLMSEVFSRLPIRSLETLLLPRPGHSGIFKLPRKVLNSIDKRRLRQQEAKLLPVKINQNDILLLADATWMEPNFDAVENARRQGAVIATLVYDLIPITHPQFFPDELVGRFKSWFASAAKTSDFFLCISEHVASELRKQLVAEGMSHSDSMAICKSFPLGSEIPISQCVSERDLGFTSLFGSDQEKNPHFVLGTLEPRKNHAHILNAFDSLWENGSSERLCIVGRKGWNCDGLIERIRNHSHFGSKLFLFTGASDADVQLAYQRAKSVIMASHTEGYGLPIVEALKFGQTVLASDTPIHREVGRDAVEYFKLDSDGIELRQLIARSPFPRRKAIWADRSVSWGESYSAIVDRCVEMTAGFENVATSKAA